MLEITHKYLHPNSYKLMMTDIAKAKLAVRNRTAWRIEGTLREFPKFAPLNMWFDYPVHREDTVGVLKDCEVEDSAPNWKKNFSKKKTNEDRSKERKESIETECRRTASAAFLNWRSILQLPKKQCVQG